MCIGCHWSLYREFFAAGQGPTRREALRDGIALTATAVAAGAAARPSVAAAQAADGKADLVFRGGAVYTVDGGSRWARAVAVRSKRIVYVGDDAGAAALIGPATRVVELNGRMLLPGFIEGHTHPIVGSAATRGVDL